MKHTPLIEQLSSNLKPVNQQKSFKLRFIHLLAICFLICILGISYWYYRKSEFHIPSGRPLLEGITLFCLFILSVALGTFASSPVSATPQISKKPILFTCFWVITLLISFISEYLKTREEALIALQYNTWLCPMVILTIAIPSFIYSVIYIFRGSVLYSIQAIFYSSTLSLSLGALGLLFICPWSDPLHEILWHMVPVLGLVPATSLSLNFLYLRLRKRL